MPLRVAMAPSSRCVLPPARGERLSPHPRAAARSPVPRRPAADGNFAAGVYGAVLRVVAGDAGSLDGALVSSLLDDLARDGATPCVTEKP